MGKKFVDELAEEAGLLKNIASYIIPSLLYMYREGFKQALIIQDTQK